MESDYDLEIPFHERPAVKEVLNQPYDLALSEVQNNDTNVSHHYQFTREQEQKSKNQEWRSKLERVNSKKDFHIRRAVYNPHGLNNMSGLRKNPLYQSGRQ
ncbi:PREDICTED: uncharacterized protein LOC109464618 [Branchiostoma belcheri]|uniref:Uncharacterized protein LOC109464618 n=1 Tax=Branchiostoma belcheri TaxID=7741 RepID=A0A6P4XKV9_BRABE|nr:PREDICTED: uncharacterized protein LOC109464618 [Branchiostoma belcheri]